MTPLSQNYQSQQCLFTSRSTSRTQLNLGQSLNISIVTVAVQAVEGRGSRGRGRGRGRRGRGRGRWSSREDTPPSEPDMSGKSDSETDFEMAQEDVEDEGCDHLFGCASCRWQPEGCAECMLHPPVMQRPQNVRWKPEKGRPQKVISQFCTLCALFTSRDQNYIEAYLSSIDNYFLALLCVQRQSRRPLGSILSTA